MFFLRKLFADRNGLGAIEYALVASLISVAAIAAFATLGGRVDNKYAEVDSKL